MKKRIISALIIAVLAGALIMPTRAVVDKSADYYVADYAGVLSDTIEQDIISANIDLEQKCDGAQIVVVTVEYLDGMFTDEYAMQLFNDWGVGSETANNGMLLLLATGENKAWLTVGAGISGSFTDTKIEDYFDQYFWTDFDKGRFEIATSAMLEALFSWYADYYNVNQNGDNTGGATGYDGNYNNGGYYGYNTGLAGGIIVWLLIILIIIIVFVAAFASDRRRYRAYYTHLGTPMPPYYFWYMWGGPHRHWWGPGGPRGPRGPGGPGGPGGPSGGGFGGFGGGGRSGRGGGFGGFGGGSGGGGFGGFGGGRGGGGFGGGGGGFGGGGGGRR